MEFLERWLSASMLALALLTSSVASVARPQPCGPSFERENFSQIVGTLGAEWRVLIALT